MAGGGDAFSGLLQEEDKLWLTSIRLICGPRGIRVVKLQVPVTPEFLAAIAPDLGAIQLNLMQKFTGAPRQTVIYESGDEQYSAGGRIAAKSRSLQPEGFWIDPSVSVVSRLNSVYVSRDGAVEAQPAGAGGDQCAALAIEYADF